MMGNMEQEIITGIPEAYGLTVDLALQMGAGCIRGTVWSGRIDELWQVSINGSNKPAEVKPDGTMGCTLQPFEIGIFFNGWLACIVSPSGGCFIGDEAGNEDTYINAVKFALNRNQQEKQN